MQDNVPKKDRLRDLDRKDFDRVVEILEQLHTVSRYKDIPFEKEVVLHVADFAISNKASYFAKVIVDDNDVVIGGLHGYLTHFVFSKQRFVQDSVVFLDPSQGSFASAHALVEAFKAWAKERGAVMVNLGTSSGIDDERIGKLYETLGMRKCGELYSMEI